METQKIKSIVEEIRASTDERKVKDQVFRAKYPVFIEQLPKLYEAALNPDFPLTYLDFMLKQLDMLSTSKATLDSADKVVYDQLNEGFVNKLVPVPVPGVAPPDATTQDQCNT